MWRNLVFLAPLIAGVHAFAPTPIRWGGLPARRFVVVPDALLNSDFVQNGEISLPASLAISEQLGRMSPGGVPQFRANPDKTISWDAAKLCLEASGERSGDAVRVNRCDGGFAQQWDVSSSGFGQQSWIKQRKSHKCAVVADKGSLNGALIELRECDNRAPEWMFEGSSPDLQERNPQSVAVLDQMRPVMAFVFAMMALAGLSIIASWWRQKNDKRGRSAALSHDVLPWTVDEVGVCLINVSANLDVGIQGMVPAVMTLSPTSGSPRFVYTETVSGLRVSAIVPDVSQNMLNVSELQLLTDIVNCAYTAGEQGMWKNSLTIPGEDMGKNQVMKRTSPNELADQLRAGKLVLLSLVACQDESKVAEPNAGDAGLNIVGCVYLDFEYKDPCSESTGAPSIVEGAESSRVAEFGMLAVADEYQGKSLGNFLISAAERYARAKGCGSIRCEILSPKEWKHPMKVRLDQWYRRLGYVKQEEDQFDVFSELFPDLVNALACPCKFDVYLKSLAGQRSSLVTMQVSGDASDAEQRTLAVDYVESEAGFAALQADRVVKDASATQELSAEYTRMVEEVREVFQSGRTKDLRWRRKQLEGLIEGVQVNVDAITEAIIADLGGSNLRATFDMAGVISDAKYALANLKSWAKPKKMDGDLRSTFTVRPEPKGVALVMGAWNFPVSLVLQPLIPALAAGCCVVIKPSEMAPCSAKVVERIVNDYLDQDCVKIVQGAVAESTALLEQRWDHIFYTGNGVVGRIVLQAAARHLTPVTLELGGKSPVIIDSTADMTAAVNRIFTFKACNQGQICVAPDYVLIDETRADEFVTKFVEQVRASNFSEGSEGNPNWGKIINERHTARLKRLIDTSGGEVMCGGAVDVAAQHVPLTVIKGADLDAPIMHEEIFGPILPVIPLKNMDDGINLIKDREHPLALYIFSQDKQFQERVLNECPSGGASVNTTMEHMTNKKVPFGGTGASGMGQYHGKYGFDEFSHLRTVLYKAGSDPVMPPPEKQPPWLADVFLKVAVTGFISPEAKQKVKALSAKIRNVFSSD